MSLAQRSLGQLLIVASACLFALSSGLMKILMNAHVSKWSVFAVRGVVTVLLNQLIVFHSRGRAGITRTWLGRAEESISDAPSQFPGYFIYLRGAMNVASVTCLVTAYENYMTFSDSFALYLGLVTLFSNMIAYLLLREHVGGSTVVGAVLCVVGIMFVVRPPFLFGHSPDHTQLHDAHHGVQEPPPPNFMGVFLLALASLFYSTSHMFLRILKDRAPQTLLHGFMSVLGIEGLVAMVVFHQSSTLPSTVVVWLYLFGYILMTQLGQILGAKGFQYETMSVGSVLTNMEMCFAFLVDTVVLHEHVTFLSLAGATTIFVGGGIVAFGNSSKASKESSESGIPSSTGPGSCQSNTAAHVGKSDIFNENESAAPLLSCSDDGPT